MIWYAGKHILHKIWQYVHRRCTFDSFCMWFVSLCPSAVHTPRSASSFHQLQPRIKSKQQIRMVQDWFYIFMNPHPARPNTPHNSHRTLTSEIWGCGHVKACRWDHSHLPELGLETLFLWDMSLWRCGVPSFSRKRFLLWSFPWF